MTTDPLQVFAARHDAATPREAIEGLVGRLRLRSGQRHPPFDVEGPTLDVLRAFVRAEALPDRRARLDLVGGHWRVLVDANAPWVRRRFVVGHEIGHMLVLDSLSDRPDLVKALRAPSVMPSLEQLCSHAAAELLMPRTDVLDQLRRIPIDAAGLTTLRLRYQVSSQALLIRVADLLDTSTSVWRPSRRPKDPPGVHRLQYSSGRIFMPRGISSGNHLDVDVVRTAFEVGAARAQRLVVTVERKVPQAASARAVRFSDREVLLVLWPLDAFVPAQSEQLSLDGEGLRDPQLPLWSETDTYAVG